jgi:murein DD-endopeptidase MepM/ murein hydrolase activator NlpD
MIPISNIVKGNFRITSDYGQRKHPITRQQSFHNGVDLNTPEGTPVYAPIDGEVTTQYTHETGGITCYFDCNGSIQLRMCHLQYSLPTGSYVSKGQEICRTGNTGRSTAPHLHLGVMQNNVRIDPKTIIQF